MRLIAGKAFNGFKAARFDNRPAGTPRKKPPTPSVKVSRGQKPRQADDAESRHADARLRGLHLEDPQAALDTIAAVLGGG
jgi:hypothetical protein